MTMTQPPRALDPEDRVARVRAAALESGLTHDRVEYVETYDVIQVIHSLGVMATPEEAQAFRLKAFRVWFVAGEQDQCWECWNAAAVHPTAPNAGGWRVCGHDVEWV